MALLRRVCEFILLFSFALTVSARLPDGRLHGNVLRPAAVPMVPAPRLDTPVTSRNGTTLPAYTKTYYFTQLIDHTNPSLGTFKQRYWFTYEFYEPGGPIILMTPGEVAADGYYTYLTNKTMLGLIAQQQNGSTVVLEHRFFGLSNPYPDLTVKSLKYHTVQQAINDLAYFAQNVVLPMPGGDSVTPDKAPWVLVGGSYSGALTSWTMVNKPGLFAAGYASSAVVQAQVDFWGWFEPMRQTMPANCSADVEAVIARVDQTFMGTNTTAIQAIKNNFNMGDVTHLDDAAGALRNNLWDWQSLQPTSGAGSQFTQFCDALEVKNGYSAPASGWGVDYAMTAWGNYWRSTYYAQICGGDDPQTCFGTYDTTQPYWSDASIGNTGRSWMWLTCNELGFFQDGAPTTSPTLASRLIQPVYDERQCQQMFPATFPSIVAPNAALTNTNYHGWNVSVKNLFFANGMRDPWREATVSADGLYAKSTSTQPIAMGDGFHCSDLLTSSNVDASIASVQAQALASMRTWLAAWKPSTSYGTLQPARTSPQTVEVAQQQSSPSHGASKPVNAWFKSFGHV